jgi:hypothetical protein
MADLTPNAPVPPDELMAQWWSEDVPVEPRWSRHMAMRGAAWGWEQAIPEREELAGLLMEADSVIECHVDHHDPDYAVRQLLRAAAERLREGGADG